MTYADESYLVGEGVGALMQYQSVCQLFWHVVGYETQVSIDEIY